MNKGRIAAKAALWVICLAPAARLGWGALHPETNLLGVNPVQYLLWAFGWWALLWLTLTLAITPLRLASSWTWLARFQRPLGLFAFAYAVLHFLTYALLDQAGAWGQIPGDLVKRPFIVIGMLTLLILLALAITSTKGWQKRLKRNWKRLHRLVYLAAILSVIHFAWKEKVGWKEPRVLVFAGAVALLLLTRLFLAGPRGQQRRDLGKEHG
ncbi:MAG TPA: protein-methionine-sulfoxide reductase heme-binding subunit MsrQ [Holophagaceae bacterium]|jgi:sulfoxide reductase heme-binding subunit YedZ|nr:protein-methionine-sulfoxide reductase heme-binding subunit MsrQ [Holophagaceae bacterium]